MEVSVVYAAFSHSGAQQKRGYILEKDKEEAQMAQPYQTARPKQRLISCWSIEIVAITEFNIQED